MGQLLAFVGLRKPPFVSMTRIGELFYEMVYDELDYDYAKSILNFFFPYSTKGSCSGIRNGNYFGRNYDWFYNNDCEFLIKIPRGKDHYASINVASGMGIFTKFFVEKRWYFNIYKALPFIALDGINEKGVACSVNVVPSQDCGITCGTNPESKNNVSVVMLVRYILDHYDSAEKAVNDIKNNLNLTGAHSKMFNDELHYMILDEKKTFILEIINNKVVINECPKDVPPYMTNFFVTGCKRDKNGHIDLKSVTPHSCGIERYDIITDNYNNCNNYDGMLDCLKKIKFSNTYNEEMKPFWFTGYIHHAEEKGYGDLVVNDIIEHPERFDRFKNDNIKSFKNRTRKKGDTYETVHTSIYDIKNKKLFLMIREDFENMLDYEVETEIK